MPIIGITASSNQTIKLTNFISIATTTVGVGGASSVTFSSIPTSYKHLQIRSNALANASNQQFRFNGDTGLNYFYHTIFGDGGTVQAAASGVVTFGYYGYSGTTAQPFAAIIDILDYNDTNKRKVAKAFSGSDMNGSGYAFLSSTAWTTSAITSITLFPGANTFLQNSSFALYGVL